MAYIKQLSTLSLLLLFFTFLPQNLSEAESVEENLEKKDYVEGEVLVKFADEKVEKDYVEGEVLVKFADEKVDLERFSGDVTLQGFEIAYEVESEEVFEDSNLVLMVGNENESTKELIEGLENNSLVEYVEPNFFRHLAVSPDDTLFSQQWGLHNTGQSVNGTTGTADADIDAPEAYDVATGGTEIIVAVVDTGIRATHEDLVNNLWNGSGGCNDDTNTPIVGGCPNHGWDFRNDDNNPDDDHGHGTIVSGIVGAKGNNATGISGVSQQSKIMALKFLNSSGNGTTADAIKSINFARYNGAKIINASYTGDSFSQSEKDAIDAFPGLLIAAAGNGGDDGIGDDNDSTPQYPASYTSTNIIAVAASNQDDELADFSNYGDVSVDLAAPGVNIRSTDNDSDTDYALVSGTSAAAPFVSGAASLLWNFNSELSIAEVKNILVNGGDAKAAFAGNTIGGKRLNLFKILSAFTPVAGFTVDNVIPATQITQVLDDSGLITISFRLKDAIEGRDMTLNSFGYSVDGGVSFSAPTNSDSSAALSENWDDNSYVSAVNFGGAIYSFTLDTKHTDLSGLNNVNQEDVQIRFKVSDGVAESAYVVSESFSLNLISPSIIGLTDDDVVAKTKTWEWSSDDPEAVFRRVIDQNPDTVLAGEYDNVNTGGQLDGDGTFYLHVQAKNNFENTTSQTVSVVLDNSAPVITSIIDDADATNSKTWEFISDDLSEVQYRYVIDQTAETVLDGEYEDIDEVIYDTDDGTFYIHVQAKDALEHASETVTASFVMDTTPPDAVSLSGIPTSSTTSRSLSATVSGTGITHFKYKLDGGSFSAEQEIDENLALSDLSVGTHSLEVFGRDAAGNFQTEATTASWTIVRSSGGGGGGGGSSSATTTVSSPPPVIETPPLSEATPNDDKTIAQIAVPFTDTKDHWAESYIEKLYNLGVVQGKEADKYAPTDNLTRAELIKIALLTFAYPASTDVLEIFQDVPVDSWYFSFVTTAFNAGIAGGYTDGTFRPNAPVNRAEALKILLLAARIDIAAINASSSAVFADVKLNDWFAPYVYFAFNSGIVNGKTSITFAPGDYITRAEMAKIAVITLELPK